MLFFARNGNEKLPLPFPDGRKLLSEAELFDDRSVSLDVLGRKIRKQLLSVTDHLGKTSLRMEVFRVLLHVLGQRIDAIGQDRNLHFGRTGVILVDLVLLDQRGFDFFRDHVSSPFCKFLL